MAKVMYNLWPRERIPQREDNAEVREAVRKYKLTEMYLTQKYSRKQVGYAD